MISFGADSFVVIDRSVGGDPEPAVFDAETEDSFSLSVDENSQLLISNAKAGRMRVLGEGVSLEGDNFWAPENMSSGSPMLRPIRDPEDGDYIRFDVQSAGGIMPRLDPELAAIVEDLYKDGLNDEESPSYGRRFLTRAVNFVGSANLPLAERTIESAARIAMLGGVPQMTKLVSDAVQSAVTQRLSLGVPDAGMTERRVGPGEDIGTSGSGGSPGTSDMAASPADRGDGFGRDGLAIWLMPVYQSQSAWGMKAGNFRMDRHGALGGLALGADWTWAGAFRAGLNFGLGGGHLDAGGELAGTTNDFSFWGVGLYGGFKSGGFGLAGDLSYTGTYNKVRQELPGLMDMEDLRSDIRGWAISTGLRAECRFETDVLDLIPHVGARYMRLVTESYDAASGGHGVLDGDAIRQDIWTFPIGMTLSGKVGTESGLVVKPSLDLSVIPAAGDVDAKSTVRFAGCPRRADLEAGMMDRVTFQGIVGVEVGNETVKVGVNYALQASSHTTAHGVFGTIRWEF